MIDKIRDGGAGDMERFLLLAPHRDGRRSGLERHKLFLAAS